MTSERPGKLGYRRDHGSRRAVKWAEVCSRALIRCGGIGTIVAVSGVFLFLLWVVVDLFLPARVGPAERTGAPAGRALAVGSDEYRVLGWTVGADGNVRITNLRDGEPLDTRRLAAGEDLPEITAVSVPPRPQRPDARASVLELAAGFADGSVRPLTVRYETRYHAADGVPPRLRDLAAGDVAEWEGGIVERTPIGQYRLQTIEVAVGDAERFGSGEPIVALHRAKRAEGPVVAALTAAGELVVRPSESRDNPFTGRVTEWLPPLRLDLPERDDGPEHVCITDLGTNVVVAWRDGHVARFAIRDLDTPALAEEVDFVDGDGALTAMGLLLGNSTLLAGDSLGRLRGWFVVNDPSNAVDGTRLVAAHSFDFGDAPVTAVGSSQRERMFAAATADRRVHVAFMTSEKRLADIAVPADTPITALAIAPKDDGLIGASDGAVWQWDLDPRHPEITWDALFGKIWYERYAEPEYVWQSSSGTDDFEKKFSLVPLIFGTVKATLYSMLFGVPLALLAAVYTSEFMHRRTRNRIKPIIEMMASLPSVVLGFIAALVIAPLVERVVPGILTSFVTVPLVLLLGAYLWRIVPRSGALRLERFRPWFAGLAIALGLLAAVLSGSAVERMLFGGDIRAWLDAQPGTGTGTSALFIALLPIVAVLVLLVLVRLVNPLLRRHTAAMPDHRAAALHLGKFCAGAVAVIALAAGLAWLGYELPTWFGGAPLDLRRGVHVAGFDLSPIGTLDQRNALVVGFIMGFAVIPIIYTIAEDALSSVPEHLRAASLGAGATPWQTATRIVIPTAMSGLFSAVMIGLGRAVGETMIVLMAAGNTPVLSMNAFSGFRTLSANIATELPEAARDSTHYRTLFLAALVLFSMTFLINTLAETVRLRFRRRAYAL